MMAKHKNIVRFLGYCADRQGIIVKYEGKLVMADIHQRLLCFEYLPNGSLHEYITDTSCEPQWRDYYQIITGICQGLHYLHQKKIAHLDLKPANILLDDNLEAKIADFGLSWCFIGETGSQIISKIGGTPGYLAPETFNQHAQLTYRHSYRLDIYSLGLVIMEILIRKNFDLVIMETDTGKKGNYIVDNVVESWSNMLERSHRDEQMKQVRVCAEIGIKCISFEPMKRPDTQYIINRLDGTETMDEYIETGEVTSQETKHAPNKHHHGMRNSLGETSSKEDATIVLVARSNSCNSIWENTANLDKLNENVESLNTDIRRCLEFCSIFPRGSTLRRDDLVRLWIAQGFVRTTCATNDLEDIAVGYIQDLVSSSLLQPVRSSSDTDCFKIHDVLHDILEKVAENCFRIENAGSHSGDGLEGDVPRHIQHLLIQHYDGQLISKTIVGLEYLCTLIVHVVGKDTTVEEKIIECICKRLPKLRVLAIAFSQEHDPIKQPNGFSFPESIGELKFLQYLAFRTSSSCKISLPSTLNKLQHIQVLDFADGDFRRFTFATLVNLRHISCWVGVKLPYVGRLISLQKFPCDFQVSNEQGCELKQMRDLNKLRGKLGIRGLENAKSKEQALEANLAGKERLTELTLSWGYDDDATWCSAEVEADVLEGMCPPAGLEKLMLDNFVGSRYPDWMVGKHSGGPKCLQKLRFWRCSQLVSASGLAEAFPHLHELKLWMCSWDALPGNMEHLTSLKELWIYDCKNIRSLPTLPQSLEDFTLGCCNYEFVKSCQEVGHANWQKIEHIPYKNIR
uniref:Uncharacterized protein n=1 Tax=Avena sativa TaxID=4498 RepID=A0ACD5U825_AVESA